MNLPHLITGSFKDATKNFDRIGRQEQLVNTLPLTPFKGQVVYYQNVLMAEKGVVWTLRSRSGKWEFVGGSPLTKGPEGSITFAKIEEKALTGGPELTVPRTGEYLMGMGLTGVINKAELQELQGLVRKNGVSTGTMLYNLTGSTAFIRTETTNSAVVSLIAGDVLTIGCKEITAVESTFSSGVLSLQPVRVI